MGTGLCKPLTTALITYMGGIYEGESMFIENASTTLGGLPACKCYYGVGKALGYKMFYRNEDGGDNDGMVQMVGDYCSEKCIDNVGFGNPCQTEYFYKYQNPGL